MLRRERGSSPARRALFYFACPVRKVRACVKVARVRKSVRKSLPFHAVRCVRKRTRGSWCMGWPMEGRKKEKESLLLSEEAQSFSSLQI